MNQQDNSHWAEAIAEHHRLGQAYVLITLLNVKGSAPREAGTKLLIATSGIVGSIGGGNLEYMAIKHAQNLLSQGVNQHQLEEFVLGEELGQCCGGRVSLLFECFAQTAEQLVVFGAGHVGRALMAIVEQLPVNISWVDSRAYEFPDVIARNAHKIISANPVEQVANIPKNAYVVIMTHDHSLDYDIAVEVLKRRDARYCGIIGSLTKARRFKKSLANQGFSKEDIETLRCPIGLSSIPGKRPMEIAVSIAAELISNYFNPSRENSNNDEHFIKKVSKKLSKQTDITIEKQQKSKTSVIKPINLKP